MERIARFNHCLHYTVEHVRRDNTAWRYFSLFIYTKACRASVGGGVELSS